MLLIPFKIGSFLKVKRLHMSKLVLSNSCERLIDILMQCMKKKECVINRNDCHTDNKKKHTLKHFLFPQKIF